MTTKPSLDDVAREWFTNMLLSNTPNTDIQVMIERASTLEDREGFDRLIDIMVGSGMMMAFALRGDDRISRAMGSSIVTALLLGAHLSKEGYL